MNTVETFNFLYCPTVGGHIILILAAFRESIRKKNEWIKQADEEFKRIREERRQLAL